MVHRDELITGLDDLLDPERMPDHGPNGLQVEGGSEIQKVVTAVTASKRAIDHAVDQGADALLVHHGIFWGAAVPLVGWLGARVRTLMKHDISLIAYHLPLDAHPELGNNRALLDALDAPVTGRFGAQDLGFVGTLAAPVAPGEIVETLSGVIGQVPIHLKGGRDTVQRIGVVSGAGQRYFEDAIAAGCDLYVTGEASEFVTHVARESGVHYVWGGHHATEKGGIKRLGDHVAATYGVKVSFFDDDNPV